MRRRMLAIWGVGIGMERRLLYHWRPTGIQEDLHAGSDTIADAGTDAGTDAGSDAGTDAEVRQSIHHHARSWHMSRLTGCIQPDARSDARSDAGSDAEVRQLGQLRRLV